MYFSCTLGEKHILRCSGFDIFMILSVLIGEIHEIERSFAREEKIEDVGMKLESNSRLITYS